MRLGIARQPTTQQPASHISAMIKPFQTLWDDVKGNALWDAIKSAIMWLPIFGSGGAGFQAWLNKAPPMEIVVHVLIAFLTLILVALVLSHIMWAIRSPSLEIGGEDCVIFPENHEGGVHACRIGVKNPSHRSVEIILVEVLEMDMTASRDKISAGIPFPIELFPLDGAIKTLDPGEILPVHLFEMPKLREAFGRSHFRATFPQRLAFPISLNQTYRMRIRVLIRNTPEYRERFILRVNGDGEFATIVLRHIPRWKTVP